MHAYAGRAYICRMYAPSMLFPPTQIVTCVGGISILGACILHTRYNYSSATYLTFFFSACVDALVSNES